MAADPVKLPAGFELEQSQSSLPTGFELETAPAPGMLESFGRGLAGGATFGLEDKLGMSKTRQHASEKANPVTHFAGELVGSVVPMVAAAALPTGVGQAADAARAAQLAGKGMRLLRGAMVPGETKTIGQAVGQGAKIGSVYGGMSGAGHADVADTDTWEQAAEKRLSGAAAGAATGVVLGPALGAAGNGIGKGVTALGSLAGEHIANSPVLARIAAEKDALYRKMGISSSADGAVPESMGARAAADQVIANQLRRAGVSAEELDGILNRAAEARRFNPNSVAPDALAAVDLDPSLQRLAGSVGRQSPEAANIASDFMYGRQTGLTPGRGPLSTGTGVPTRPAMARPVTGEEAEKSFGTSFGTPKDSVVPMGQAERIRDAMKRAFLISDKDFHGHAANAYRTDQTIINMAKNEAQSLYGAAYSAGQNVNVRPIIEPILQRWQAAASEEPGPVAGAIQRAARLFQTENGPVTSIERFDKSKQYLDGQIEKLFESPVGRNRYLGGVLNKLKSDLLEAVDAIPTQALGEKYATARGAFGSRMEAREALQMGRDAFKQDSDVGVDAFRSLKEPGLQKLFRLGFMSGYEKAAFGKPRTSDVSTLFDNPRIQELLAAIIPKTETATGKVKMVAGQPAEFANRPERFGQYLGNEKRMVQTRNEVAGNSKTAQRLADDEAFETLSSVVEAYRKTPSVINIGVKLAESALNKVFGYRADTSAAIARSLFTADPAARAQVLARVRQRMGSDRFTYFTRLLQQTAPSPSIATGAVVPEMQGGTR